MSQYQTAVVTDAEWRSGTGTFEDALSRAVARRI